MNLNNLLIYIFRKLQIDINNPIFNILYNDNLIFNEKLNIKLIDRSYERLLDKLGIRKKFGIYYTPNFIVKWIINDTCKLTFDYLINQFKQKILSNNYSEALEIANKIIDIKILDPACGTGSFIIETFNFILLKYIEIESFLNELKYKESFKHENNIKYSKNAEINKFYDIFGFNNKFKLIFKIINRHIYGLDIDNNAILITKFNLIQRILSIIPKLNNYNDYLKYIDKLINILNLNICNGNFLIDFNTEEIKNHTILKFKNELIELILLKKDIENCDDNFHFNEKIKRIYYLYTKIEKYFDYIFDKFCQNNQMSFKLFKDNKCFYLIIKFYDVFFKKRNDNSIIFNNGFDIIIGNPPFFTEVRGNKDIFRIYKISPIIKEYYEQKSDIFYFFIERGLDILKNEGYLGYIIMDYWRNRTFGRKLRQKIMKNSKIIKVYNFKDIKIFSDATGQHNSILILKKIKDKNINIFNYNIEVIDIFSKNNIKIFNNNHKNNSLNPNKFFKIIRHDMKLSYNGDKIFFYDDYTVSILNKLKFKQNYKIPKNKIFQGLVLPQKEITKQHLNILNSKNHKLNYKIGNGIFILSEKEKNFLNLNNDELKLLKPFYKACDLHPFHIAQQNKSWVIYINKPYIDYDLIDLKRLKTNLKINNERVHKIVLKNIKQKYPNIVSHLDKFQKIITSDKKPYGIHRPRNKQIFESKNKIISVRKTKFPRFAYVPFECYMDQSVYYILIDDFNLLIYLLGLLNSKLAWFYFKISKTHGEQLQIDKLILHEFPVFIPNIDLSKISKIIIKIIQLKNDSNINNDNELSIKKLINTLDIIFFKLYNITINEVKYILEFIRLEDVNKNYILDLYSKYQSMTINEILEQIKIVN